jgi:hypothetical protein
MEPSKCNYKMFAIVDFKTSGQPLPPCLPKVLQLAGFVLRIMVLGYVFYGCFGKLCQCPTRKNGAKSPVKYDLAVQSASIKGATRSNKGRDAYP